MRGLVLLVSFLTSSCYLSKQGLSQLSLLNRSQPVSEVLKSESVDSATKDKLRFSQDVLNFAKEEGLTLGTSYQNFVKLDGPAVSYIVQAAYPHEFELKTWWFPIVGTVPYLGFFDVKDRDAYAKELLDSGYEIHKGAASAFSSLGWFSDPIYSSMLNDDDAGLAHLYFHELTHQTAWIKGSAEFNENFAEFIAETLTEKFFRKTGQLAVLEREKVQRKDKETFKVWLKVLKDELKDYFSNMDGNATKDTVILGKEEIIRKHVEHKPAFQVIDYVSFGVWNTPRILGASLYSPDTEMFRSAYQCYSGQKIGAFILNLKDLVETSESPEAALLKVCK